jgi:hypothetical protein
VPVYWQVLLSCAVTIAVRDAPVCVILIVLVDVEPIADDSKGLRHSPPVIPVTRDVTRHCPSTWAMAGGGVEGDEGDPQAHASRQTPSRILRTGSPFTWFHRMDVSSMRRWHIAFHLLVILLELAFACGRRVERARQSAKREGGPEISVYD